MFKQLFYKYYIVYFSHKHKCQYYECDKNANLQKMKIYHHENTCIRGKE